VLQRRYNTAGHQTVVGFSQAASCCRSVGNRDALIRWIVLPNLR
jgi:hypothetical protein